MGIELSYRQGPGCLVVEAAGEWTTDNAKQAINAIHDEAGKRKLTSLLLDVRKLSKPDLEVTRYFTGEHFAKVLGHPFNTAAVVNPEIYNKFAEIVALNRGAKLAVFFEEEKALEWLLKGAEQAAA